MTRQEAIQEALTRLLASGNYAHGRRDYLRVQAHRIDGAHETFSIHLTFKRGERYCCAELGCHVGYYRRHWWRQFRTELAGLGVVPEGSITIKSVCVTVEDGALLGLRSPTDDRKLRPSASYSYEDGPFEESSAQAD